MAYPAMCFPKSCVQRGVFSSQEVCFHFKTHLFLARGRDIHQRALSTNQTPQVNEQVLFLFSLTSLSGGKKEQVCQGSLLLLLSFPFLVSDKNAPRSSALLQQRSLSSTIGCEKENPAGGEERRRRSKNRRRSVLIVTKGRECLNFRKGQILPFSMHLARGSCEVWGGQFTNMVIVSNFLVPKHYFPFRTSSACMLIFQMCFPF